MKNLATRCFCSLFYIITILRFSVLLGFSCKLQTQDQHFTGTQTPSHICMARIQKSMFNYKNNRIVTFLRKQNGISIPIYKCVTKQKGRTTFAAFIHMLTLCLGNKWRILSLTNVHSAIWWT